MKNTLENCIIQNNLLLIQKDLPDLFVRQQSEYRYNLKVMTVIIGLDQSVEWVIPLKPGVR